MDAAGKPTKIVPGDEMHLTLLGVLMGINFLMDQDRQDMLSFGRSVWDASRKHSIHQACEAILGINCEEVTRFDAQTAIRALSRDAT